MSGIPAPMPMDLSEMEKAAKEKETADEESASGSESMKAERKECANCGKTPENPLRCGVCKKVVYCDRHCQKEDWRFHKRNCKKPQPKKDPAVKESEKQIREKKAAEKEKKEDSKPKVKKGSDPVRSTEEENVVVEDEKLDWYRHREWHPENKQEFKPHEIASPAPQKIEPTESENQTAKSVWNTANTYEERNTTEWANEWLKSKLPGCSFDGPEGLQLVLDSVDSLEGDAAIPFVRGSKRFVYDYRFKLSGEVHFRDCDLKAEINIDDFANDMEPYTFHVTVKEKKGVDSDIPFMARNIIVKQVVPQVQTKLAEFVRDYHEL